MRVWHDVLDTTGLLGNHMWITGHNKLITTGVYNILYYMVQVSAAYNIIIYPYLHENASVLCTAEVDCMHKT